MPGTVLYRKWRPHDFHEIVGQDAIVRTLRNAVAQGKIAHAYLFAGPRGTGKTTTARILARAINAPRDGEGNALLDPATAQAYDEGSALDLVEIDAASNRGIDDIRELRERANYAPGVAQYKVYLIDEVHQLTGAAADALLKTLEEPPPHVIFILATTEPEALKATILSRCQRFDFRRVAVSDIVARLREIADAEGISIPDEALQLIAREATGSLRDAVNLLDQVWAAYGDAIGLDEAQEGLGLSADKRALDVVRAALKRELPQGLSLIGQVQAEATDLARFKKQIVTHLRHALLLQTGAAESLALSDPEREALTAVLDGVEPAATVAALKEFTAADLRGDPYQPLPLELALARVVFGETPAAPAAEAPRGNERRPAREPERRQERRSPRPEPPAAEAPRRRADRPAAERSERQDRPPGPPPSESASEEERLLAAIRDYLRTERKDSRLAALINGPVVITGVEGDLLTLGFTPQGHGFHLPEVRTRAADVASAASAVLGREVRVECVAVEEGARASNTAATPERPAARPASDAPAEEPPAEDPAEAPKAKKPRKKNALVAEAERLGARVVESRPE